MCANIVIQVLDGIETMNLVLNYEYQDEEMVKEWIQRYVMMVTTQMEIVDQGIVAQLKITVLDMEGLRLH